MIGADDDLLNIVFVVGLMAAVICLLVFFQMAHARSTRQIRDRINRVGSRAAAIPGGHKQMADLRKASDEGSFKAVEAIAKKIMPRPALMRQRLAQTGYRISLGQYLLLCLFVGGLFSMVRGQLLGLPMLPAVLLGIVSGLAIPHFVVGFLINRRTKKFLADFPEAIDLIVRGLKSGLPVPESIRIVGEEFDGVVGQEFAQISERVKFGQTLDEALWDAVKRVDLPDFKFFVVSLSVQRETGGNLAETLENLTDILRKRRQMKLKIKAMSSEAKVSAMILGSLPFVMFAILAVINGPYVMALFSDPRGHLMLAFAFTCLGIGIAVMWKMVRFEI